MENKGCHTIGCLLPIVYFLIQIIYLFFFEKDLHRNLYFLYSIIVITTIFSIFFFL